LHADAEPVGEGLRPRLAEALQLKQDRVGDGFTRFPDLPLKQGYDCLNVSLGQPKFFG
jgi:hypothetical protein